MKHLLLYCNTRISLIWYGLWTFSYNKMVNLSQHPMEYDFIPCLQEISLGYFMYANTTCIPKSGAC